MTNSTSKKLYSFSPITKLLIFTGVLGISLVLHQMSYEMSKSLSYPSQLQQLINWLLPIFMFGSTIIAIITPAPKAVMINFLFGFSCLHWGFFLKSLSLYRIFDENLLTTQYIFLGIGVIFSAIGMIVWSRDQREHFIQINHLNATDSLTGLFNTKTFHEVLELEIDRIRRYRRDLTLILIRIDSFKVFNEDFGYHIGDEILRTYGKSIKSYLRRSDMGCRFSGSEFAILLPETPLAGAKLVAHRLRLRLAEFTFTVDENESKKLTTSASIVELHNDDTPQTLIQRSEIALDTAKSRGIDQLIAIP